MSLKKGLMVFFITGLCLLPYLISLIPTASNQGYYPEQPIPFSHKIHAGQYKMDCRYCHSAAEKSVHASIPGLSVCMNCHTMVKVDSPYIKKLTEAYKQNKPIEWVRVHELPDYVYFPHKRHLAVGVKCEDCHGDVTKMERIEQHGALTMGWCMQCHRGESTPEHVLKWKYPNQKNPSGPVAPVECSTCHK
jgi:hypothetical protein